MAATPAYGLPFPTEDDDLNVGAYNIQQLAEALDAQLIAHRPAWVTRYGSSSVAIDDVGTFVPFESPIAATAEFASDGTTITYTGPARLFLITASITVIDAANHTISSSGSELRVNGNRAAHSTERIDVLANFTMTVTHQLTALLPLASGDEITATMVAYDDLSTLGDRGISVVSQGGPQ